MEDQQSHKISDNSSFSFDYNYWIGNQAYAVIDLTFKNNEQLGQTDLDRKAIFDIYCENEKGEK